MIVPVLLAVVVVAVVGVDDTIIVVVGVGMLICKGSSGCGVDDSGNFLGADSWFSIMLSRSVSCK